LPIAIFLILWGRLPEQMQVNIMPNPLMLSRTVVTFAIPVALTVIHLIASFAIVNYARKENQSKAIGLCWLTPIINVLAIVPLLLMNI